MKHVDSLAELREVKDTMFNAHVESNFINPLADGHHRFQVRRLQSLLEEVQKVSCNASGILRKRSDVLKRRCDPEDGVSRTRGGYTNNCIRCQRRLRSDWREHPPGLIARWVFYFAIKMIKSCVKIVTTRIHVHSQSFITYQKR